MGGAKSELELSDDVVRQLASTADVDQGVIRTAARDADRSTLWERGTSLASRVDDATEGVLSATVTETACDYVTGQPVSVEGFLDTLQRNVIGLTQQDLEALIDDVNALIAELQAAERGSSQEQADAIVFCFAVEHAT